MPSSTITIRREIDTVTKFIRRAPLTFTGTNDPAFTIGDWVRGFMLSPPFAWRWNRAVVTPFSINTGQDYTINIPNFGWLEQATIIDKTVSPNLAYQLEIVLDLGEDATTNQPTRICARLDDGNGNITFRVTPPPDKTYTLNLTYQIAAPIFQTLDDYWAPIPDYLHFLYHSGFLAKAYEYMGDERFPAAMQLFVRQLVATNGGLNQSQLNIFMADQVNSAMTLQSGTQGSQIATQARSLT